MKQSRLTVLLMVLGVLVLLRIFIPPRTQPPRAVAEAVVHSLPARPGSESKPVALETIDVARVENELVADSPGNAFSVKTPPQPVNVSPPPPVVAAARPPIFASPIVATANLPPASPPSPFQVIGTWDDGKEPGVFLSSSSGVLFARPGTILQAEYRVVGLTAQQISFVQIASKREFTLPVSRPAASPQSVQ